MDIMTDEEFAELIQSAGFAPEMGVIESFKRYYELLVEKNKVMNLTAITEYNDVIIKHFVDSLLVNKALKEADVLKVLQIPLEDSVIADIGTGAGFPGIPLKICMPESRITLIDSLNKRIRFLDEVIEELGLVGIKGVHGRCEELGKNKEFRERFDVVLSRAVAALPVLSEYCLPFVKVGGIFVAYKADGSEEEIKSAEAAVKLLGGEIAAVAKMNLPGTDYKRCFCVIKKVKECPKKYPRKPGTPAKEPL